MVSIREVKTNNIKSLSVKHVLGRDLKADPKGQEMILFHHWVAFYQIMFCSQRSRVLSEDECCYWKQKRQAEEKQLSDAKKD